MKAVSGLATAPHLETSVLESGMLPSPSFVNWASIAAGSFIAAATLLVLMPFGAAVGLSMTSVNSGQGASASTIGWLAITWFALTHVYSAGLGGYVTGRLRPTVGKAKVDEVRFRDGMGGLIMWAVGIIVSTTFMASVLANVVGTAATTARQALEPVAAIAARGVAPNVSPEYLTDLFLRGSPQAAATPARTDADIRAEVGRVMATGAVNGEVSDDDRRYLATVVAQRTGLSEADARIRVNEAFARANQLRDAAQSRAKEAAETARKATASAAFWMTILSLMTGVAAWYFAQLGGRHRDEGRYGISFH
jgi:hypothetical protein